MPNYCENFLRVDTSKETVEKIEKSIEEGKLFETFIPLPSNESSSEDNTDWCIENWGTKWDICEPIISATGEDFIELKFYTAWSPPIPFYKELLNHAKNIKAYYGEPSVDFYGVYDNGDEESYDKYTNPDIPKELWEHIEYPEVEQSDSEDNE